MTTRHDSKWCQIASCFVAIVILTARTPVVACEVSGVSLKVGASPDEVDYTSVSIPVRGTAYFHASCSVSENPDHYGINWEFDLDGDGTYEESASTSWTEDGSYLHKDTSESEAYETVGTYNAKVRACLADGEDNWVTSSPCAVTAVQVDRMQYNDPVLGWVNVPDTLYVMTGTTVGFRALPYPADALWPQGKPVWGGAASGSGVASVSVTFSGISPTLLDPSIVTVECGNDPPIEAAVIVYDFSGLIIPVDLFDFRSYDRYGLEEEVDLSYNITPEGLTASLVGGLTWIWTGVGQVVATASSGTGLYDAMHVPGNTLLILKVDSGPSVGRNKYYSKDVIPPEGTRMTRVNGMYWHEYNKCTVGFLLYYWLDPTDVSFKYLKFGEDACPTTDASGYFTCCEPPGWYPHGTPKAAHSRTSVFSAIIGGNITTGCRVLNEDTATTAEYPLWDAGSFKWHIPAMYEDNTLAQHTFGDTKLHHSSITALGKATVTKDVHTESANLTDSSTPFK